MHTLGWYLEICKLLFGSDSKATKYIVEKIAKQGKDEVVLADETQMISLLDQMDKGDAK